MRDMCIEKGHSQYSRHHPMSRERHANAMYSRHHPMSRERHARHV